MCFWCNVAPCILLDSGRQLSSARYDDCIWVLSVPCLARKGRGLPGQPVRAWQCCAACTAWQQPGVRPTPTPASEQPLCFPMQLTMQIEYIAGLYLQEPGIHIRGWHGLAHLTVQDLGATFYVIHRPLYVQGFCRVQPHPQKLQWLRANERTAYLAIARKHRTRTDRNNGRRNSLPGNLRPPQHLQGTQRQEDSRR